MSENNYKLLGEYIVTPDYSDHFRKGQEIHETYFYKRPFERVHGKEAVNKYNQYKQATGVGFFAYLTKFGFAYLGGMIQARKQFIYKPLYFNNHFYNWMKGFRYMFYGYIVGAIVSTFAFGHPYLLEDYIRSKFRSLTVAQFMDRGYKPM